MLARLPHGVAGGYEEDAVESEPFACLFRTEQMAQMDGVERPTHDTESGYLAVRTQIREPGGHVRHLHRSTIAHRVCPVPFSRYL